MSAESLRLSSVIFLAAMLISVASCSRVSVAYNSADFLIESYAEDYLALDDPQVACWRPTLESALARHRREDLPYLARFFNDAHKDAVRGFDERRMRCLLSQFDGLYRRHMRLAVDLAAPLLVALKPDQIRSLEREFRKEQAEDGADAKSKSRARRERKRAERYQESITWWIGPLTKQQKRIVREQTATMPDAAADWNAYRGSERKMLIDLLERRASEAEIHRFLASWLVEHQRLPASLRKAQKQIEDRISDLFIRLDKTFSARQRDHFTDRLATIRNDFLSLQRSHPRMATVKCADSG